MHPEPETLDQREVERDVAAATVSVRAFRQHVDDQIVTLFGITLRNSIMLVSHYQYLIDAEGLPWNVDTALKGAAERLPSILMTALVTALGLLPLALGSGEPGREIEGPMATIIVGGLITSTVLNLLILPTVLLHFGRFELSRLAHRLRLVSRLLLDLLGFPPGGVAYFGGLVGNLLRDHGGLVRGSLRYRSCLVVSDREDPLCQRDRVLVPCFHGPAGGGITLQR